MSSVDFPSMPAAMLLTLETTSIAVSITITCLPGFPRLLLLIALSQQFHDHGFQLGIVFIDVLFFLGIHLPNSLRQFVGQGVDLVVHQLGAQPPIIIHRYTLNHVVAVLILWHCTSQSLCKESEVVYIRLQLLCTFLHILAISQLQCWYFVLHRPNIQLHPWLEVLLQLIPQLLCSFMNSILLLQRPVHSEQQCWPHESMFHLQWFKLGCIHHKAYYICTMYNAENLLLLKEYVNFHAAALVFRNIKLVNWEYPSLLHVESIGTPLQPCWWY